MTSFELKNPSLKNYLSLWKNFLDEVCKVSINGVVLLEEYPLLCAISISSKIGAILQTDANQREFIFNSDFLLSKSMIFKIQQLFNGKLIQIEKEEELISLAFVGLLLGNDELNTPYFKYLEELGKTLNLSNAVTLLHSKILFGYPDKNYMKEVEFIAKNFMKLKDKLIEMVVNETSNSIDFSQHIELILSSSKLSLDLEDSLLDFIIKLCNPEKTTGKDNKFKKYEYLFKYVKLQYCSNSNILKFMKYVETKMCNSASISSVIECMKSRIIQTQLPLEQNYIEGRHSKKMEIVSDHKEFDGIFRREYLRGNLLLIADYLGDIYEIVKDNQFHDTYTNDKPNSSIIAKLKDGRPFIVKSYKIRGRRHVEPNRHQLQRWKLEGRKLNGDLVLMEEKEHVSTPFTALEVKRFETTFREPVTEIILTQTGPNTCNTNHLCINAFDVFGMIC